MAEFDEAPLFSPSTTPREGRPYFGSDPEQPLFSEPRQQAPTQQPALSKEQYEKMPWQDVLSRAGEQLIPSAGRSLAAIPAAIYNYPETGHALKQALYGGLGAAGLRTERDPAQKAEQEAIFSAMVEPVTATYHAVKGEPGEFKKLLAEDPYSLLTAAATPIGGGLAKAGELVGAAGTAGRALTGIGKAARYTMDPTQAVMGGVGDVAGAGLEKLRQIRDISTNVPRYSYERAAAAGALPAGDLGKIAFNDFARGQGDAIDFSQRARKATEALKNQAMQDWISTKGAMTGAAIQDVPLDKIYAAVSDARKRLGPQKLALNPEPYEALQFIVDNLNKRASLPSGHPGRTLEGIDQLKQQLYDYAKNQGDSPAGGVVMNIHAATKSALNDISPEYQQLMDKYQAIDDAVSTIQKGLGTGNKTAANAEMAKFIKSQKTPEGRDLISQLAQYDPLLPYMTAGSTLHSGIASGVPGALEKGALPLHALNIAAGVMSANPFHALSAMGLAGTQAALQSPSLMGDIAYQSGRLGATPAAKAIKKIPSAVQVAQPLATNLARSAPNIEKELIGSVSPMEEERPYFPGSEEEQPVARATGGRVMTADRMMSMAKRAKKEIESQTKALLEEPDEHIVKALKVANEHI
jgi:hypothetical protein